MTLKDSHSSEPSSKALIVTATYNEADNIRPLIADIFKYVPNAHVLVIDDNSPDGTAQIVRDLAAVDNRIALIQRPRKLGLGTAHKLAKMFAEKNGYRQLVTMDADFSHDPKYLPTLTSLLESNDFVIGSRYTKGGSCEYGPARQVLSRGANFLSRLLLGLKIRETTTSYRGFSKKLLHTLRVDEIRADGYSFFIESIYRVSRATSKMAEFPIHFGDRRAGISKISKTEIFRGFTTLFRLFGERLKSGFLGARKKNLDSPQPSACPNCGSPFRVTLQRAPMHKGDQCLACGSLS